MNVEVVFVPRDLEPRALAGRAVVVLDVLRATTSMAAALAAGVGEIRLFDSTAAAAEAARAARAGGAHGQDCILCGEERCLPPPGFDLGNSPSAFTANQHAGHTLFMSTTNGTRALVAARRAAALFAGALVNAAAVARQVMATGWDVTLLCAGTDGEEAMEDVLGAGAVIDAMAGEAGDRGMALASDRARLALRLFRASRGHLLEALLDSRGGRNVLAAGLGNDVSFAAQLNVFNVVGRVWDSPLRLLAARSERESG
jgi:2-phosphosulfolactate phosphatase